MKSDGITELKRETKSVIVLKEKMGYLLDIIVINDSRKQNIDTIGLQDRLQIRNMLPKIYRGFYQMNQLVQINQI